MNAVIQRFHLWLPSLRISDAQTDKKTNMKDEVRLIHPSSLRPHPSIVIDPIGAL
jgi:hypothetical protein